MYSCMYINIDMHEKSVSYLTQHNYISFISAHKCSYPGCKSVLVVDGNMKNRRDICAATHAGFTEYSGLPGALKTGCQHSPAYQSKFCYHHSPRVACMSTDENKTDSHRVVRLITNKKETRNGIYYEVYMHVHEYKCQMVLRMNGYMCGQVIAISHNTCMEGRCVL